LKLTTKQPARELLFAPFMNLENALNAIPDILKLKITPTGIEFMEKSIIDIIEKYLKIEIPYHQYNSFLMIIVDGESENEIYNYFAEVEEICKRHHAVTVTVPSSQRAKRKLLNARENFYHALKKYAPMEVIDIVVPRNEIANLAKKAKTISEKYEIPIIVYGHAGDGNVHLHPLCMNMDREEWNNKLPHLMTDLYRAGVSLGGAVSGEHGIGFDKKPYFNQETDNSLLTIMKEIKKTFDPNNILNPGKIFEM
jgi:glycolate oxidase